MDTSTSTVASPDSPEWLIGRAVDAFANKQWAILAAMLLMATIFVVRKLSAAKVIPDKAVPWVTQLCTLGTAVALGIYAKQPWQNIVTTAVTIGLMATGLWETVGKFIRDILAKFGLVSAGGSSGGSGSAGSP